LADGLEPNARFFPYFFIPVIQAGELGGRHVEAFQLIHEHCQRLKPTLTLLRHTWLYPLICILAGWTARTALFLCFGMFQFAWLFVRDTLLTSLTILLVAWALVQTRPVKALVDAVLLQLPLVRETLIRLSIVLFFSTFRLGYEAGGLSVITAFDLALATVPNRAIRRDLARARPVLAEGGSFEDAFAQPCLLEGGIKNTIAAGALSGRLGSSLAQIIQSETLGLEVALTVFNRVFQSLVAYGVATSVAGTVLFCVFYSPR
jgi:type II secretory pathway component PulF